MIFFSLCYVPHHFLGFSLEIIRYHAETPSHKLNFEERKQLDEDVSVAEVEHSAVSLNKAPNLKGLSAEIYKHFQQILENFLTKN